MRLLHCAVVLFVLAPTAGAADHLFPTDMPAAGQVDAALGVGYNRLEWAPFQQEVTYTYEFLQLRAGLGGGLALGASAPYISGGEACIHFREKDCDDIEAEWGDAAIAAKYRFVGAAGAPFSSSVLLQYNTNSSGDENDGYVVGLAGGWTLDGGNRVYAILERDMRNDEDLDDSTAIALGVFAGTGWVRFVPEAFYTRFDGSDTYDAYPQYGGQASLHFGAGGDVVLIPTVRYAKLDAPGGDSSEADGTAMSVGLTIYAAFGGEPAPAPPAPRKREAASGKVPPSTVAPAAVPEPAPVPPAPAAPAPALQPGPLALPQPVPLYPAPRTEAQPLAILEAGATVTLKSRVQNAAGYWWFVEGAKQKGWLRESSLR